MFTQVAKKRGIELLLHRGAESVRDGKVICTDGSIVHCDEVVWCTNAGAAQWLRENSGLDLTSDGFIKVRKISLHSNEHSRAHTIVLCMSGMSSRSFDGFRRVGFRRFRLDEHLRIQSCFLSGLTDCV